MGATCRSQRSEETQFTLTKYKEYVKPKSNRVFAKYKFHQKVQQEGDSFEQFLNQLI